MLPRKAKGKRPQFCEDPQVDKLVSIIMALAGEVQVLRERLDTTERVARAKGLYSAIDIESYQCSARDELEREEWRDEFLSRILWIVEREVDSLQEKESLAKTRADVEAIATR